jgi:hypothetical protein
MNFEWLRMRIQEEQDRRTREAIALDRLPRALDELHGLLKGCVDSYNQAFGEESASIVQIPGRLTVTSRDRIDGKPQTAAKVEIIAVPEIPGFRIERGDSSLAIELGVLPSDNLYYRDCEQDTYLTMDELTRRMLDRVLFPKLRE